MPFKSPGADDIDYFKTILSPGNVLVDEDSLKRCASDQTEDLYYLPMLVLQPEQVSEVSAIMRYCNDEHIAVTPRGAGTGLSGGALPVHGGVSLDMRRMNRIIDIDTRNFQVITEPGVITQVLQEAVRERGLFYPARPCQQRVLFYWRKCSRE